MELQFYLKNYVTFCLAGVAFAAGKHENNALFLRLFAKITSS